MLSASTGGRDHLAYSASLSAQRAGMDVFDDPTGRVGFALGQARATFSGASYNGAPESSLVSESNFAMVYTTQRLGNGAVFEGQLQFGEDHYTTRREIRIANDARTAFAEFDGTHMGISGRMSWPGAQRNGFRLQPDLGASFMYYSSDAFQETNAGDLNLAVGARTTHALFVEAGLSAIKQIPMQNGGNLGMRLRTAVQANLLNENTLDAAFAAIPGSSFTVNGQAAEPLSISLEARMEYAFPGNTATAFLQLDAQYHPTRDRLSASARVGISAAF